MKKILAASLSGLIALSFVGCGNGSSGSSDSSVEKTETISSAVESSVGSFAESSVESSVESATVKKSFHFADYESEDIFDIGLVDMDSKIAEVCETYQFTFLSDGYRIKGFISIPVSNIASQTPCQCLLYCRGGNSSIGSLSAVDIAGKCYYAKRVVIACELRGCNGSEGTDQFGGDELHDVMKLIDLCDKRFSFVDMEDFCVAGESRGGMMTYMAARQDKRIKRIIVASGISDAFQCYEDRYDMQAVLYQHIGCTPDENPEEYEKRSAYYWADEITVPVLLIHGKEDQLVSFEQSEKMYEKLKDHTSCAFLRRDDDYHGISQDDYPQILEWLNNP